LKSVDPWGPQDNLEELDDLEDDKSKKSSGFN